MAPQLGMKVTPGASRRKDVENGRCGSENLADTGQESQAERPRHGAQADMAHGKDAGNIVGGGAHPV